MRERALILDRPGNDRDQKGHFGRRQRLRFPPEIAPGRGPQATQVRSPFDDVQVDLENTILAERRLEQERDRQFLELSSNLLVARQKQVLGQLLRDCRCAAGGATARPVGEQRDWQFAQVDAAMSVEACVFCKQQRANEQRWNVAQGDEFGGCERDVDRAVWPGAVLGAEDEIAAQALNRWRHLAWWPEVDL